MHELARAVVSAWEEEADRTAGAGATRTEDGAAGRTEQDAAEQIVLLPGRADDKTVDAAALEALGVRLRTPLRAGLARQVAWAAAGANANDVFRCPLAFIK